MSCALDTPRNENFKLWTDVCAGLLALLGGCFVQLISRPKFAKLQRLTHLGYYLRS